MAGKITDFLLHAPAEASALEDDECSVTYAELLEMAGTYASFFQQRYGRSKYILLEAELNVQFISALFGVLFSGNTPIPVAAQSPRPVLDKCFEISGAVDFVSNDTLKDLTPLELTFEVNAERPALVLFTSGTSGDPKGVIISHENVLASCAAIATYLDYFNNNSAAVVLPLHYSYGLLSQVLCQLMVGGFSRLFPNFRNLLRFQEVVNQHQLKSFCGVPSTYAILGRINKLSKLQMPDVQVLCTAGAAMNQTLYPDVKEIFPNATLFNNYGMTEATPRISYVDDKDPRFHQGSCGRLMDGMEAKIIDPDDQAEKGDNEVGMLVVKGPNITKGYLNEPEKTKRAFTSDGYLITGDMARISEGHIYVLGRRDDMFNVGGEKVSPLEIEKVLNDMTEVEVSAVIGVDDPNLGKVPVAFLVLREEIKRSQLSAYLSDRLNRWAIPFRYYSVTELPMTNNGKIQRRLLDPEAEYIKHEIQ
jgi:acyl-CoA synthetase (AMP-forming)/AMP-acid ligase II